MLWCWASAGLSWTPKYWTMMKKFCSKSLLWSTGGTSSKSTPLWCRPCWDNTSFRKSCSSTKSLILFCAMPLTNWCQWGCTTSNSSLWITSKASKSTTFSKLKKSCKVKAFATSLWTTRSLSTRPSRDGKCSTKTHKALSWIWFQGETHFAKKNLKRSGSIGKSWWFSKT